MQECTIGSLVISVIITLNVANRRKNNSDFNRIKLYFPVSQISPEVGRPSWCGTPRCQGPCLFLCYIFLLLVAFISRIIVQENCSSHHSHIQQARKKRDKEKSRLPSHFFQECSQKLHIPFLLTFYWPERIHMSQLVVKMGGWKRSLYLGQPR